MMLKNFSIDEMLNRKDTPIEKDIEDLLKVIENIRPKINQLDTSNVENKDLDKSKPLLQFVDYDNVVESICNVEGLEDGLEKIQTILKDSDYPSYYFRTHEKDNTWYIDYGSHTTAFRVTKEEK